MPLLRADMHGRGINGGGKESRCVNGFDSQIVGMPFEGSSLLCRPLRRGPPIVAHARSFDEGITAAKERSGGGRAK